MTRQKVIGEDGSVFYFENGESPEEMQRVLAEHYKVPQPAPEPDQSLGQWAGVATRALAPTALSAAAGGLAAAPTGVGAPFGAAAGITAQNIGELGTQGYNAISSLFGGRQVPLPSETMQNQVEKLGIGRKPQTAGQQVFSDVVGAAGNAGGLALSATGLATKAANPVVRAILQQLGAQPKMQAIAAAGGAAAPSIAANNFGVTNPWTLAALGFGGSMLAGTKANRAPETTPPSEIRARSQAVYKSISDQGLTIRPNAYNQALTQIDNDLHSRGLRYETQPEVLTWRNRLNAIAASPQPLTFSELDSVHSDLSSAARAARQAGNDRQGLYLEQMARGLDRFILNLNSSQVQGRNAGNVGATLATARHTWATAQKASLLEDMFNNATNIAEQTANSSTMHTKSFPEAIQNEAKKLMNRDKDFSRFSIDEQQAIRQIANGTVTSRGFAALASLAPSSVRKASAEIGLPVGAAYVLGHNPVAGLAIGGGMLATGAASKRVKDALTQKHWDQALQQVAGQTEPGTFPVRIGLSSRAALDADQRRKRIIQQLQAASSDAWYGRGQ